MSLKGNGVFALLALTALGLSFASGKRQSSASLPATLQPYLSELPYVPELKLETLAKTPAQVTQSQVPLLASPSEQVTFENMLQNISAGTAGQVLKPEYGSLTAQALLEPRGMTMELLAKYYGNVWTPEQLKAGQAQYAAYYGLR